MTTQVRAGFRLCRELSDISHGTSVHEGFIDLVNVSPWLSHPDVVPGPHKCTRTSLSIAPSAREGCTTNFAALSV
jgi:hypothetical protein